MVGVLVLVDQDVPESAAVVLGDVGEQLQDRDRRRDEVVEVEGVRPAQAALVLAVGLGEHLLHVVGRAAGVGLVVDELVLEVRDLRQEGPRACTSSGRGRGRAGPSS